MDACCVATLEGCSCTCAHSLPVADLVERIISKPAISPVVGIDSVHVARMGDKTALLFQGPLSVGRLVARGGSNIRVQLAFHGAVHSLSVLGAPPGASVSLHLDGHHVADATWERTEFRIDTRLATLAFLPSPLTWGSKADDNAYCERIFGDDAICDALCLHLIGDVYVCIRGPLVAGTIISIVARGVLLTHSNDQSPETRALLAMAAHRPDIPVVMHPDPAAVEELRIIGAL